MFIQPYARDGSDGNGADADAAITAQPRGIEAILCGRLKLNSLGERGSVKRKCQKRPADEQKKPIASIREGGRSLLLAYERAS